MSPDQLANNANVLKNAKGTTQTLNSPFTKTILQEAEENPFELNSHMSSFSNLYSTQQQQQHSLLHNSSPTTSNYHASYRGLNPDALSTLGGIGALEHNNDVRQATLFLYHILIPRFASFLENNPESPCCYDGQALVCPPPLLFYLFSSSFFPHVFFARSLPFARLPAFTPGVSAVRTWVIFVLSLLALPFACSS
jgi:hypothetical protein